MEITILCGPLVSKTILWAKIEVNILQKIFLMFLNLNTQNGCKNTLKSQFSYDTIKPKLLSTIAQLKSKNYFGKR